MRVQFVFFVCVAFHFSFYLFIPFGIRHSRLSITFVRALSVFIFSMFLYGAFFLRHSVSLLILWPYRVRCFAALVPCYVDVCFFFICRAIVVVSVRSFVSLVLVSFFIAFGSLCC